MASTSRVRAVALEVGWDESSDLVAGFLDELADSGPELTFELAG